MSAIETNVAVLRDEADRLAEAAAAAGVQTAVPTCPDWTVRNLLAHTGGVHAWATTIVAGGLQHRPDAGDLDDNVRDIADDDLVDWYRAQAHGLAAAIAAAPDDLDCLAFLPAPSPKAFWARRQAHECAIHRADAESAAGRVPLYEAAFARDGIDELFHGFLARKRSRPAFDEPRTMLIRAIEGGLWRLTLGRETVTTTDEDKAADVTIVGPASDVYLWAWNRARPGDETVSLMVDGDASVIDLWRDNIAVRWG